MSDAAHRERMRRMNAGTRRVLTHVPKPVDFSITVENVPDTSRGTFAAGADAHKSHMMEILIMELGEAAELHRDVIRDESRYNDRECYIEDHASAKSKVDTIEDILRKLK